MATRTSGLRRMGDINGHARIKSCTDISHQPLDWSVSISVAFVPGRREPSRPRRLWLDKAVVDKIVGECSKQYPSPFLEHP